MRETNLNATSFFFGGISQASSRATSSTIRKVIEYKTDLPGWQGKAGAFLRVNNDGNGLVWDVINLEQILRQFPKLQADVNNTSAGDIAVFGDDYRTIKHEPLLNFSNNSLSVNTELRIPWAAINVNGDAFFHTGDGDTGLRIRNGIERNKYGFSDQYGNMAVLVNEQGKSNAALVIGDVVGPRSSSTVFGVSVSQNAESPSTGEENSWVPRMNLNGSGDLWIAGSLFQSSDKRLKKDIVQTEYGLQQLLQMRPVQYIMKDDDSNRVQLGFIAQEVEKLIPEVVITHNGYKSIAYDKLIPVIVKSIQELHERLLEMPDAVASVEKIETQQDYLVKAFEKLSKLTFDIDKKVDALEDTVIDLAIDVQGLQAEFFDYVRQLNVAQAQSQTLADQTASVENKPTEVSQDEEIDEIDQLLNKIDEGAHFGNLSEHETSDSRHDNNSIMRRLFTKLFSKDS